MSTLKVVFQSVAKGLRTLAEEVERLEDFVDKLETEAAKQAKSKTATKTRPGKKAASKKPKRKTATDTVLNIIQRSRKGVDTDTLVKKTGFDKKKIWGIVHRLKQEGKIKSAGYGSYVKA